jgi:hypothetical protein
MASMHRRLRKPLARMLSLIFGAGKESRTPDLNLGEVALCQLSYSRKKVACFVKVINSLQRFKKLNTVLRYRQTNNCY